MIQLNKKRKKKKINIKFSKKRIKNSFPKNCYINPKKKLKKKSKKK